MNEGCDAGAEADHRHHRGAWRRRSSSGTPVGCCLPVTGLLSWADPASKTNAIADELDADYVCADFSNLGQVHALADELRQRYRRIDLLANNAGSVFAADGITAEGYNPTIIGTSSSSQRLMRPTPRCAFHRVLAGPPSGGGAADYG